VKNGANNDVVNVRSAFFLWTFDRFNCNSFIFRHRMPPTRTKKRNKRSKMHFSRLQLCKVWSPINSRCWRDVALF
jgi:hypothetical protein